jgi:hypothetical protein
MLSSNQLVSSEVKHHDGALPNIYTSEQRIYMENDLLLDKA